MNNKPIIVKADAGTTYHWCTCKMSKNFPYCDGSHVGSENSPIAQTMTECVNVAICSCGGSKNSIYCDGSHSKK